MPTISGNEDGNPAPGPSHGAPSNSATTAEDKRMKCGICKAHKQQQVQQKLCNRCGVIYHRTCMGISPKVFRELGDPWLCDACKAGNVSNDDESDHSMDVDEVNFINSLINVQPSTNQSGIHPVLAPARLVPTNHQQSDAQEE